MQATPRAETGRSIASSRDGQTLDGRTVRGPRPVGSRPRRGRRPGARPGRAIARSVRASRRRSGAVTSWRMRSQMSASGGGCPMLQRKPPVDPLPAPGDPQPLACRARDAGDQRAGGDRCGRGGGQAVKVGRGDAQTAPARDTARPPPTAAEARAASARR